MDLGAAVRTAGRTQRDGYRGTLYVIRNGKLGPEPDQVERRLPEIAGRAISTLVKYSAYNELYRIHSLAYASDYGFRLAAIPDDFESKAEEMFDPVEMKRLFELGYEMGLSGALWRHTPPRYLWEE